MVFLDCGAAAAAGRKARLDELAGREFTSDAQSSPGPRRSWPTCCRTGRRGGLTGFRLRPGTISHDLEAITRASCLSCSAAGRSARLQAATLRGLLGLPRPANRYATA